MCGSYQKPWLSDQLLSLPTPGVYQHHPLSTRHMCDHCNTVRVLMTHRTLSVYYVLVNIAAKSVCPAVLFAPLGMTVSVPTERTSESKNVKIVYIHHIKVVHHLYPVKTTHGTVGSQYIRKIYFFSKLPRGALFFCSPPVYASRNRSHGRTEKAQKAK